ncbi:hypothetical protein QTG54_012248 [Skeletonema marinoi]|uniref:Uncharacterized protein n=1 Tax=Skeletonema marinoi TaxID=267567 RepID=A0AAD8Y0B0_9STRA|nr:hypothetical protein QTG54_012248 [Skeletonema marinoi]
MSPSSGPGESTIVRLVPSTLLVIPRALDMSRYLLGIGEKPQTKNFFIRLFTDFGLKSVKSRPTFVDPRLSCQPTSIATPTPCAALSCLLPPSLSPCYRCDGQWRWRSEGLSINGGVCVRHEAKRKLCSSGGCTNKVIEGGVCRKHGAKVKRCSSEGINNGVCVKHGAKIKRCSTEGCTNKAQKGGVCYRHRAKAKRCSSDGCTNQSRKGGVCIRHGAKIKRCSPEGCTNNAQKGGVCRGGVCVRHGARAKRCSSEGCTNVSVKGGVCKRHGAISIVNVKLYNSEGANQVQRGGVCWRHGANRITHNESTAFGSEFEKTTATRTSPNQRAPRAAAREGQEGSRVFQEVAILCQDIIEWLCEFEKTTATQTPPNQLLQLPQEKDRKEVEFFKRLPFFVKKLLNDSNADCRFCIPTFITESEAERRSPSSQYFLYPVNIALQEKVDVKLLWAFRFDTDRASSFFSRSILMVSYFAPRHAYGHYYCQNPQSCALLRQDQARLNNASRFMMLTC